MRIRFYEWDMDNGEYVARGPAFEADASVDELMEALWTEVSGPWDCDEDVNEIALICVNTRTGARHIIGYEVITG